VKKLTVVVTCTERKSLPTSTHLQVRNLPSGSLAERSNHWRARVSSARARVQLAKLYQGETWTQVVPLVKAAEERGFSTRLLVASAGLGLRDVDSEAPSYRATFSSRHLDSVASSQVEAREWWNRLKSLDGALSPLHALQGRVLLVLSAAYANAMADDLRVLAERQADAMIVGGAADTPGLPRLAADRSLRRHLGGTATSLNLRIARTWLERNNGTELYSPIDHTAWETWAATVRQSDVYTRAPMTDERVIDFIRSARRQDPLLSRTRALRALRDSGLACEQKRFAGLFTRALEAP
jgi:hypothetical protein